MAMKLLPVPELYLIGFVNIHVNQSNWVPIWISLLTWIYAHWNDKVHGNRLSNIPLVFEMYAGWASEHNQGQGSSKLYYLHT
jgi:hypothetical protein